jgi:hypothetical protein
MEELKPSDESDLENILLNIIDKKENNRNGHFN